jgi:hypothetical protein
VTLAMLGKAKKVLIDKEKVYGSGDDRLLIRH